MNINNFKYVKEIKIVDLNENIISLETIKNIGNIKMFYDKSNIFYLSKLYFLK